MTVCEHKWCWIRWLSGANVDSLKFHSGSVLLSGILWPCLQHRLHLGPRFLYKPHVILKNYSSRILLPDLIFQPVHHRCKQEKKGWSLMKANFHFKNSPSFQLVTFWLFCCPHKCPPCALFFYAWLPSTAFLFSLLPSNLHKFTDKM